MKNSVVKKIIQIPCHTYTNDKNLNYHVDGSWGSRLAKNIVASTSKYKNEVWYTVTDLDEQKKIDKNNLTYRLFPAKTLSKLLESYNGIISSPQFFQALAQEDPENTIIHIQGERGSVLHKILHDYHQFKIVVQVHGYGQPKWLDWLERIWITPQERRNFPHIEHVFVPTRTRLDYLLKVLKFESAKISFQYTGVDFERFQPIDKLLARKKLNLPQDAYIIMFVGVMIRSKGVDHIINAYNQLKQKYPQVFLLLIGASESDPLYKKAHLAADRMIGVTDNKELPEYYNAADVYCFYGNNKIKYHSGLGVAPSEALACNLNVISTNLIHFPPELVDKVGFAPNTYDEFVNKLDWLINHPDFRYNARTFVEPLISSVYTTKNTIAVYDKLFL